MCNRFPLNRPKILETWVKNMGIPNFKPALENVLCADHFTPDCFTTLIPDVQVLRSQSVPTLFALNATPGKQKINFIKKKN